MNATVDTIGVMSGHVECSSVLLGAFGQDFGFFSGNPLLHPELAARPCGFPMEVVPYSVQNDNVIGTVVIMCFFLMAILIRRTRSFVSQQANGFFHSPAHKVVHNEVDTSIGVPTVALMHLLLAIAGSLLVFYHAYATRNLFLCRISPYGLAVAYAGMFSLFFVLRNALSSFINWIFFEKASRRQWRSTYNFLLLLETWLLFPLISAGIYLSVSPDTVLRLTAAVIVLFRMVLLYKTFTTFLLKIYCILHLLSYLCALEIIPLLILWEILNGITDSLIITF
ncbi:MAG: DUF4271 domain-containing protein [Bacteroidaceae bacterium]|nr:DUF4271 domain-containing protein [Bacteroidaceae bacterium]